MSNDPDSHADYHQCGVEAVEPWFGGDEVPIPSLCEFDDSVYSSNDNGKVTDDNGDDKEFETARFGEGGGNSLSLGIFAGAEIKC